MLTIYPKVIYYQSNNIHKDKSSKNVEKSVSQTTYEYEKPKHSINFQGYYASKKNRYYIEKIVDLVKDESNKRIAIFPHKSPDGDAIGSAVALAHIIKKATDKIADIFVSEPLDKKLKLIDANNEIKVISEILSPKATSDEMLTTFGKYDLAIGVDNPDISLFPDGLYEALFDTAKHTVKIDHHPAGKGFKNRNYAHINLIDLSKESAAQLVMEFVKPFNIDPRTISKEISDPLTMGLLSDSQQFKYPRNPGIFKDAAELSKTSDFEEIIKAFEKVDCEEFVDSIKILNNTKFANNGKIAYYVLDIDNDFTPSGDATGRALVEISKIEGVKYYFSIKKKLNEVKASIRSNDKPIRPKVLELGGDGHDHACGLKWKNKTAEELVNALIEKLIELDKN